MDLVLFLEIVILLCIIFGWNEQQTTVGCWFWINCKGIAWPWAHSICVFILYALSLSPSSSSSSSTLYVSLFERCLLIFIHFFWFALSLSLPSQAFRLIHFPLTTILKTEVLRPPKWAFDWILFDWMKNIVISSKIAHHNMKWQNEWRSYDRLKTRCYIP